MRLFRPRHNHGEEPDWPVHEARAGHLAGAVRPYSARGEVHTAADAVARRGWGEAGCRGAGGGTAPVLVLLMRPASRGGGLGAGAALGRPPGPRPRRGWPRGARSLLTRACAARLPNSPPR